MLKKSFRQKKETITDGIMDLSKGNERTGNGI